MTPPLLSSDGYALLVRIHGHLGSLGLVLLLHPLISLGRPGWRWGQRWSAALAALLISLPYGLGTLVYPSYRARVKPDLVAHHHGMALAFEVKEHLAFCCLVLTWGGVLALWATGQRVAGRKAARSALACALICGVIAGGIGLVVGAVAHPGWQLRP